MSFVVTYDMILIIRTIPTLLALGLAGYSSLRGSLLVSQLPTSSIKRGMLFLVGAAWFFTTYLFMEFSEFTADSVNSPLDPILSLGATVAGFVSMILYIGVILVIKRFVTDLPKDEGESE